MTDETDRDTIRDTVSTGKGMTVEITAVTNVNECYADFDFVIITAADEQRLSGVE
jgi:hypothetical protein